MPRPPLLILAGLLVGALATWSWMGRESTVRGGPSAPVEPPARDDAAAVLEALVRLEARLDRLEARLERPGSTEARVPFPAIPPDIVERLDELTALVRELARARSTTPPGSDAEEERAVALQDALEDQPQPNWVALDDTLALWRMDPERARMEVQLLSFAAVVERFGRPNLTWGGPEEVVWVYGRDYLPESESYRLQIMLHFVQGVVTKFYVEDN